MSYSDKSTTASVQVSTVRRKKSFADIDLSLPIHPYRGDLTPLKDDDAIKNSVKNLILTNFYERPFQPDKGANLVGLLFEHADAFTALEIEEAVRDVLGIYEPRIIVNGVICNDDSQKNAWRITVNYTIRSFGIPSKVGVVLKRLR